MEDLLKSLQIMAKKGDVPHPTHCEHDELFIYPKSMDFTDEEFKELDRLGWMKTEDGDGFCSFKFGSC